MPTTILYHQATMKELTQLFSKKVVKNKTLSLSKMVPKSTPTRFICITLDYTIPYSTNVSELTEYSLDQVIDISVVMKRIPCNSHLYCNKEMS